MRPATPDYYTEFAGAVQSHVYGPGQVEWGARLAREHDNLLAAMAFALDTENVGPRVRALLPSSRSGVQVNEAVLFDPARSSRCPAPPSIPARRWRSWRPPWVLRAGRRPASLGVVRPGSRRRTTSRPRLPGASRESSCRNFGEAWPRPRAQRARRSSTTSTRSVDHHADDLPALAAIYLGVIAQAVSYQDPAAARSIATEGLELARQTGMPSAIAVNLAGLALALVQEDPARARALLAEALQLAGRLGYVNLPTSSQVPSSPPPASPRMAYRSRAAGPALHYLSRSGAGAPNVYSIGLLNLVAGGLAQQQPEPAAIVQGALGAMMRRVAPDVAAPARGGTSSHNDVAAFAAEVRRDTTQRLIAALGKPRLDQLEPKGRRWT